MKIATLPALNSKKEPNLIDITNRKLDESLADGTKFQIAAEKFEYNQFESLAEFIQEAGSEDYALELINDYKRDAAVTAGKNYIRTATKGTQDEVIAAGLNVAKSHTLAKSENITAKDAKDALLAIKADASNLSDAEIAARVRALMGI